MMVYYLKSACTCLLFVILVATGIQNALSGAGFPIKDFGNDAHEQINM